MPSLRLVNVPTIFKHANELYNLAGPVVFVLWLQLRAVEILIRDLTSQKLIFLVGCDIECPPKFFVCFWWYAFLFLNMSRHCTISLGNLFSLSVHNYGLWKF